jgi:hypothetical protein
MVVHVRSWQPPLVGEYGTERRPLYTEGAFNSEIVFLVDVLLELPLSPDGQRIVFDAYVNVLVLEIRQVGLCNQLVLSFVYIYGWSPRRQVSVALAVASECILEQAIDFVLQRYNSAGLLLACDDVHGNLLGCSGRAIAHNQVWFSCVYRSRQYVNQRRLINLDVSS